MNGWGGWPRRVESVRQGSANATAEVSQLIVREDRVGGRAEHRVGKEWGGAGRRR